MKLPLMWFKCKLFSIVLFLLIRLIFIFIEIEQKKKQVVNMNVGHHGTHIDECGHCKLCSGKKIKITIIKTRKLLH